MHPSSRTSTLRSGQAKPSRSSAEAAAAKTTLVNLIPRFYDVTGGAILIDGRDIRDVSTRVAPLPARRSLPSRRSCSTTRYRNNIAYGDSGQAFDDIVRAAQVGICRRFHPRASPGVRHRHRRIGRQALRRTAAADRHCPGAPERRAHPDPRRGDLVARHPIGAGSAERPRHAHGRAGRASSSPTVSPPS